MGPYQSGQAELPRVANADFNCPVLPADAKEKQTDCMMLADIWPTGWHARELAQVETGESVVSTPEGPVGLLAAYCEIIKGASEVVVIDRDS
jgi:glutathione-independent formaldehyde dehydrogenase